jgi:putative hydrolase of the HAD superfamily
LTWALERADPPLADPRFHAVADLSALPALVESLSR